MGSLEIKVYDPVSGSCLKYRTDKGAEVGRLVAGLGGCGRVMTGLPPKTSEAGKPEQVDGTQAEVEVPKEDVKMKDVKPQDAKKDSQAQGQGQGQGQSGGKRKKKGKR